jgi:superfamily I DNA and RNA helicase
VNDSFKTLGNRVALLEAKITDNGTDTTNLIEATRKIVVRVAKVEKSATGLDSTVSIVNQVGNEIDAVKKKIADLEKDKRKLTGSGSA